MARALPEIVISLVPAWIATPSRACGSDLDARRELAERRLDQRQAGDDARFARGKHGAALCVFRHRRDRGDVAGAAEILFERAGDRGFDLEWREKCVGAEEGLRHWSNIGSEKGEKPIVTGGQYGKPNGLICHALSAHETAIFVWAIRVQALCCATF